MTNPVGLDEKYPRLKWKIKDDKRGSRQIAYSITVELTPLMCHQELESLEHWKNNVRWTTGYL